MDREQIVKALEKRIDSNQYRIERLKEQILRHIDFPKIVQESIEIIAQLKIESNLMRDILESILTESEKAELKKLL